MPIEPIASRPAAADLRPSVVLDARPPASESYPSCESAYRDFPVDFWGPDDVVSCDDVDPVEWPAVADVRFATTPPEGGAR